MKEYRLKKEEEVSILDKRIKKGLREKEEESLKISHSELLSNIGYDLHIRRESYYHSLILIVARMSGYEVERDVDRDKGRIEAVLKKWKEVIIVEIKYGKGSKVKD